MSKLLILVAGAGSAAGSSVCERLLHADEKFRVRGVLHTGQPPFEHPRLECIRADLTHPEDCQRAVVGCDMAVMAAASSGGARIHRDTPWSLIRPNLAMNSALLEALHQAGVRRCVFVGSSTVYQETAGLLREDDLDLNQSPPEAYLGVGYMMRFLEQLYRFWHMKTGMETILVRAANIYGPRSRFDPVTSNVIPALIRKAVEKMDPFEIWGAAEVQRDVVYVDDFAEAVVGLLLARNIHHDVFNVGAGAPVSVGEIARLALEAAGHTPADVIFSQNQPTTLSFRGLNCTKICNTIGWSAKISCKTGISKTVQWWRIYHTNWNK